MHKVQRQTSLDGFLNPTCVSPPPKIVSHRDLIIFIMQTGILFTEKSLLRAVKAEVVIQQIKGRDVPNITREGLRRQLYQLARENLVEQVGFCWQFKD
ncbi:MAG: hypothetical protein ACFFBD_03690 [Candidatus Hodarchaeota archaeon]